MQFVFHLHEIQISDKVEESKNHLNWLSQCFAHFKADRRAQVCDWTTLQPTSSIPKQLWSIIHPEKWRPCGKEHRSTTTHIQKLGTTPPHSHSDSFRQSAAWPCLLRCRLKTHCYGDGVWALPKVTEMIYRKRFILCGWPWGKGSSQITAVPKGP